MVARRSISRAAEGLAAGVLWLLAAMPAAADSILAGTVTDAITGQPIAGAEVDVEYAGQVLGSGTTDIDGLYSVPFTVPPSAPAVATMVAAASAGSHEAGRSNFQVRDGTPVAAAHAIVLYPAGVTACRSQTDHSVIVGHFLPPLGSDFSDLPVRIARSLDYALNTRLQAVRLPAHLQPSFEACDAAQPRTPRLAARFAKALRADAFLAGNVADGPSAFTVSTYVSDAHDLFANPPVVDSRDVDLANPSGAVIAGETYAAVLAAVAAGLAGEGDCVTAVAVLSVAEQLVEAVPAYLSDLRRSCEAQLPNTALLGGGP